MGDYRFEKSKGEIAKNVTEPEKQNGEAETFLNGSMKSESPRSSPPLTYATKSVEEESERRYKFVSLVFAALGLMWIALLVVVVMFPALPKETPCESREVPRALSLCLPNVTLPPKLSCPGGHQENPRALCCAKTHEEWKDFVTAFANVEFAKRKRGKVEKAVSSTDNKGVPTRRRRNADDKKILRIEQPGIYFVSAELTLDFKKVSTSFDVNCYIKHTHQGEDTYAAVNPVRVSSCSVNANATCVMPVTIGGIISLGVNDTVSIEIDKQSPEIVTKLSLLQAEKVH